MPELQWHSNKYSKQDNKMFTKLIKFKNIFSKWMHFFIVGIVLCYNSGCKSVPPVPAPKLMVSQASIEKLPPTILEGIKKLKKEHERNAVINLTQIAVTALKERDSIPTALQPALIDNPLDLAIKRIEDVYADTPESKKARSLWHDEETKNFKGEPYERTFVFLLRGLRYYENGDFENAMACFKSGILQDSLSTEGKYNADMATFEWLIGLCHLRLGETKDMNESFQRALKIRKDLKLPRKRNNTLIICFAGSAPMKIRTGEYKEILLIKKGKCLTTKISVSKATLGENPFYKYAVLLEDIFFQATTRGGRLIDKINEYKATVKNDTKVVGNVAILLGATAIGTALILAAAQSGNGALIITVGSVGVALVVIGIAAHVTALAMKTKADIRTIRGIPSRIYIWSGDVLPGQRILGIKRTNVAKYNLKFKKANIEYGNNHNVVYVFCP
jgi:tetratricopeptide (TPR) repeat protein